MIRLTVPDFDDKEFIEVKKVLESGFLVQGKKVEEFENHIAEYVNIKHAIAVSSGTAALHLALIALDIKAGDEVIVPDFTFPATANVVELAGADTRLVDINLDDFCIDTGKIEGEINKNTKAIIPVHEFGQSADMDDIINLAVKYNLKIIEDAACALGAEYKGKKVGTMGDIGCFSLHPRKSITTGEGGIIVTNDDGMAEKLKTLRNHGIKTVNNKPQFVTPGFNYRMTEMQAAIGIVQSGKIDTINKKRKEIADNYKELLKDIEGITLPAEKKGRKHVWQTYHILLPDHLSRDELIVKLREKGIESNYGAYAVHEQPYYREKYNFNDNQYSNSMIAFKKGLALPFHSKLNYIAKKKVVCYVRELVQNKLLL